MFKSLTPVIYTLNTKETIDFYTSILCFELKAKNEDLGWAAISKDKTEIMVSLPPKSIKFKKPVFTGSFYFLVSDLEDLWSRIKDKVKICYEPELFDWGMIEFAVYDNNGYLLQFGEAHNIININEN